MSKKMFQKSYAEIVSLENLLKAWEEFVVGKRNRADVQKFERNLMTNLFVLHERLVDGTYRHAPYEAFIIADPKTRSIHKASVCDRVLHRAIYRILYPFFDATFIADSFSCRENKGTHKALDRFTTFGRKASMNHRKTVWVLKCDIRKFFASIDHRMLIALLDERIEDKQLVALLRVVLQSFSSGTPGIGLPLGNLTSQLFSNIYMNVLDQFVKHKLRVHYYIRYADDFILVSQDRWRLQQTLYTINDFLIENLRLHLHPSKVFLRTLSSGVDFLGWVHFEKYRVLRSQTKRRMLRMLDAENIDQSTFASYQGMLVHGNAFGLSESISLMYREISHEEK